jgi:hypothetical protein
MDRKGFEVMLNMLAIGINSPIGLNCGGVQIRPYERRRRI